MQNCADRATESEFDNYLLVISQEDLNNYGCPHCSEKFHESFGKLLSSSSKENVFSLFECPNCANSFVCVQESFLDVYSVDFPNDPNEDLPVLYVNKVNNHPFSNIENSCIRSIPSLFEAFQ